MLFYSRESGLAACLTKVNTLRDVRVLWRHARTGASEPGTLGWRCQRQATRRDTETVIVKACPAGRSELRQGRSAAGRGSRQRPPRYKASRGLHWLVGHDDFAGAAKLMLAALAEGYSVRTPLNSGASAVSWLAPTLRPYIGSCVRPRYLPIRIIVPNSTAWPAGSRCTFPKDGATALRHTLPASMSAHTPHPARPRADATHQLN